MLVHSNNHFDLSQCSQIIHSHLAGLDLSQEVL